MIDDHVRKLKDIIVSEETQKAHRQFAIDTMLTCVAHLPHKVMIYAALTSLISLDNEPFVSDIVSKVVESLQESLVQQMDIQTAKNLMRYLALLVDYRVVSS